MSHKLSKKELKLLNKKENNDDSIDDYRNKQEEALYKSRNFFRNHQF